MVRLGGATRGALPGCRATRRPVRADGVRFPLARAAGSVRAEDCLVSGLRLRALPAGLAGESDQCRELRDIATDGGVSGLQAAHGVG
jgi:hypothetical protein